MVMAPLQTGTVVNEAVVVAATAAVLPARRS
jgi:hypothetical protein